MKVTAAGIEKSKVMAGLETDTVGSTETEVDMAVGRDSKSVVHMRGDVSAVVGAEVGAGSAMAGAGADMGAGT